MYYTFYIKYFMPNQKKKVHICTPLTQGRTAPGDKAHQIWHASSYLLKNLELTAKFTMVSNYKSTIEWKYFLMPDLLV